MRILKYVALAVCAMAIGAVLAWRYALPAVIEHAIRAKLDGAGFANARFEIGALDRDRIELTSVSLAPGLDLGDIELHAGPWDLAAGKRADVVVRRPRVALPAARATFTDRRPGTKRPLFRSVTIEDGELSAGANRIAVRGTIDLRAGVPELDVAATAPVLDLDGTRVRDVSTRVRGRLDDLEACGVGRVGETRIEACAQLDLRAFDHADVAWTARDVEARWVARGNARVVRTAGGFALADGRLEASITRRTIGPVTIEGGTVNAVLAGDVASRTFSVDGSVTARRLDAGSVVLHDARLPLSLTARGGGKTLDLASDTLALTATRAQVTVAGTELPVVAPRIEARGRFALDRITLAAAASPGDRALAVTARLHGVPLAPILATASRDHLRGTGVLDGELAFSIDRDDLALTSGSLVARGRGRLRLAKQANARTSDRPFAVHRRVAAALEDFEYSNLAVLIARDPDVQVQIRGRGRRVPQEIDLVLNVRGVRDIARRLAAASQKRKP